MFKGVLVALGIIVVSALIPIVHFIAVPISPFIGGYVGISYTQATRETYAIKGLQFGSLLGLVVLIVTVAVAGIVSAFFGASQKVLTLMWIGVVVFTLYAGSMSALGAMYAALKKVPTPDEKDDLTNTDLPVSPEGAGIDKPGGHE